MNKIYVEKKSWTTQSGEVRDYNEYYIYASNNYNIEKLKVYISLEKEVVNLLESLGALYNANEEDK